MNSRNWLVRTISLAVFFVIFAATANAQYRAGIQGTVSDPSGAAVSGAKVTVTAKDTGLSQETTTDASGVYNVNRLAPGLYTIVVEKGGFQKKVLDDVNILAEQVSSVNVALEVGQVSQSVTVNGSSLPTIDTETGQLSTTTEAARKIFPAAPDRAAAARRAAFSRRKTRSKFSRMGSATKQTALRSMVFP